MRDAVIIVLMLLIATSAWARTETFLWMHPEPGTVASYLLLWGTKTGEYASAKDVGNPVPNAACVRSATIEVPETGAIYVVVAGVGHNGQLGEKSNEVVRGVPSFDCAAAPWCYQMASCDEARRYYTACNLWRLDLDRDGVPCEALCR